MKKKGFRADAKRLRSVARVVVLVLAALFAGTLSASAQYCDQPANLDESEECARLRFRAAERDMIDQMRFVESLEGDTLKRAVMAAQDAWLKWRDAEGEVAALTSEDAQTGRVNRDTVKAQLTEDRVRDLRIHTGR